MRTRYAAPALLVMALLAAGCSGGSSTASKPSPFVPPATAAAAAASTPASPAAGSPSGSEPNAPATASPATSAVTSSSPVAATTTPAPLSDLARQVDTGTVSMHGRKATLQYAAVVTTDAEKNAVLTAFGDFERTVMIAFDSHSTTLPLIAQFTGGQQQQTLIGTVKQFTAAHEVSRGVLRYWKATVTEVRNTTLGRVATVTSCGNESKWIGVNEVTGKTIPNDSNDKYSYLQTTSLLNTGDGHWRVTLVEPLAYHVKACP